MKVKVQLECGLCSKNEKHWIHIRVLQLDFTYESNGTKISCGLPYPWDVYWAPTYQELLMKCGECGR